MKYSFCFALKALHRNILGDSPNHGSGHHYSFDAKIPGKIRIKPHKPFFVGSVSLLNFNYQQMTYLFKFFKLMVVSGLHWKFLVSKGFSGLSDYIATRKSTQSFTFVTFNFLGHWSSNEFKIQILENALIYFECFYFTILKSLQHS